MHTTQATYTPPGCGSHFRIVCRASLDQPDITGMAHVFVIRLVCRTLFNSDPTTSTHQRQFSVDIHQVAFKHLSIHTSEECKAEQVIWVCCLRVLLQIASERESALALEGL